MYYLMKSILEPFFQVALYPAASVLQGLQMVKPQNQPLECTSEKLPVAANNIPVAEYILSFTTQSVKRSAICQPCGRSRDLALF